MSYAAMIDGGAGHHTHSMMQSENHPANSNHEHTVEHDVHLAMHAGDDGIQHDENCCVSFCGGALTMDFQILSCSPLPKLKSDFIAPPLAPGEWANTSPTPKYLKSYSFKGEVCLPLVELTAVKAIL